MAILDAGCTGLLAFTVYDANLVHHCSGQVVQGGGLVVKEEGPAAHSEFVNLLAVELNLAVLGYFHTRHSLQQVFQHRIGSHTEGGGIELYSVLFDNNGVTYIGDGCRLKKQFVLLQPDGSHIHLLLAEEALFHKRFIPHHLHVEDITAEGHLVQLGFALGVSEGEIGYGGILGRYHVHRRKSHRLIGERVQHHGLDFAHPALEYIVIQDKHLRQCGKAVYKQQYK